MPTKRIVFLDVAFDAIARDELLEQLAQVTSETRFGYLVTPNVDHIVRLQTGKFGVAMTSAYANAKYCLCDSKILARIAAFFGLKLPVLPGSDLAELIFTRILRDGDRITVVGGDRALAAELNRLFPRLEIQHHQPPMNLATNPQARRIAAEFIASQNARFSFICVGSPQQELIAAEAAEIGTATGLGLCVGAALDFITGRQVRAPSLLRKVGLEWAHRLVTNPRRLWRRYILEGPRIFIIAYRWREKNP